MIVRTKEIIELQNELDELEKLRATNFLSGMSFRGVLLRKTRYEKRVELEKLYEKQMKLYLKKRGINYDTDTK
tara:strand:+ start:8788 stop:9006 length:219 start_codon:yes stop_codon:yes gene_type:complete